MESLETLSTRTTPLEGPRLPIDVLASIAESLAGDECLGTVANLNASCRTLRETTLAILYETLTLSYWKLKEKEVNATSNGDAWKPDQGWRFVK